MDLNLDLGELTLADMEDFEELTGMGIGAIPALGENLPTKVVVAMIYISQRKTNPDLTIDDVRGMKVSELNVNIRDSSTDPQ